MRRGRAKRAVLLVLLAAAVLGGCDRAATGSPGPGFGAAAGRLHVVATTTQIRSLAEAVAGDRAQVVSILQFSDDPHAYEPRPADVRLLAQADVVLENGLGLDTWLDKTVRNAGGRHPVVRVTAGVPVLAGDAEEPAGDPHVWFDVTNAMTMTRTIRDTLAADDPAGAATYQANAAAALASLAKLDAYIFAQIGTIPPAQRKMVTNHDAFGYYQRRYGLAYVGSIIPGMDSSAEPSARDLGTLIGKIRAAQVRAIFLETSINPKIEQLIAGEAGVKVVDTLYGDTLGPPGSAASTYPGMMTYDTDTIVRGLK